MSYPGLVLPDAVQPGGQLQGAQRLQVVAPVGRHVGDHGGATVDVPQRLPQQHGQLAVPASHIKEFLVKEFLVKEFLVKGVLVKGVLIKEFLVTELLVKGFLVMEFLVKEFLVKGFLVT